MATTIRSPATMIHDNSNMFSIPETKESLENEILLILNNPQTLTSNLISSIWPCVGKRVCADGGANWLFDSCDNNFIPDLVHGDLDSLRTDVKNYYLDHGCLITEDKRDDKHDMDKCLLQIKEWPNSCNFIIYIFGAFGGRFDHEMANLNTTLKHLHNFKRIILISTETFGEVLLGNTRHKIYPNRKFEGPICGLIPIFSPCAKVDTSGLKWNLNGRAMCFGGLVSSSNEIAEAEIQVFSEQTLLWTTTFRLIDKISPSYSKQAKFEMEEDLPVIVIEKKSKKYNQTGKHGNKAIKIVGISPTGAISQKQFEKSLEQTFGTIETLEKSKEYQGFQVKFKNEADMIDALESTVTINGKELRIEVIV